MTKPPGFVGLFLNVGVWFLWSVGIGYLGHRRPLSAFTRETWWSAPRRFERDGRLYERELRIKQWKHRLPELGALFDGGFAKRSVARDVAFIERFICETRRAEWVHWIALSLWPVFAIWNPPWAVGVMFSYAVVVNVPCLLVQRYNRLRLQRVLTRVSSLVSSRQKTECRER